MRFARTTTFSVDFTKKTFSESTQYKNFMQEHPELIQQLNIAIGKFISWAQKGGNGKRDLCLGQHDTFPSDTCWGCDEDEGTWEEFQEQMGTTNRKFSLTESSGLSNSKVQLLAQVFSGIGFTTYVVKFTGWRLGYDYKFKLLSNYEGVVDDCGDDSSEPIHICVVL